MKSFASIYSGLSQEESEKITLQIGKELEWKLVNNENNTIEFKSGINYGTWGHIIHIKYVSKFALNIFVETKFNQVIDSGSGMDKVKNFVERYQYLALANNSKNI